MRSSICFIMPGRLHETQEHPEISPLRYAPVEMTKEGTRGQLRGSQGNREIPPTFSVVTAGQANRPGMTKKGCSNEQAKEVRSSALICQRRRSEIMFAL